MSRFEVNRSDFTDLKGKVVVLTGGANGIGASTVQLLHKAGASVVFGDLSTSAADKLISSLNSPDTVTFLKTDVTKYADNIALFKTALKKHGRVDHAIAVAGIIEAGKWFDPDLTIETVEQPETTKVIDVNLVAVMNFARIAVVYLRHNKAEGEDKSLTLLSSAAGFRESPGLWIYQCSKHGVMGLMRTMRKAIYRRDGIRVNAVCPGMTDTQMTTTIIKSFRETGQPINSAEEIAVPILGILAKRDMNGEAVYIEGGNNWLIEKNIWDTMPTWLGEEPTRRLREGLQLVDTGEAWKPTENRAYAFDSGSANTAAT